MKTLKTVPFILLSIFIASCSKKDTSPNTPTTTYISKQTFGSIGTYTWNYDAQNRLQNIVFVSSDEAANKSYNFIINGYDASNRIVDGLYDYVSGAVADVRFLNTYNAVGKIERVDFLDNATGNFASRTTATYPSAQQVMVNYIRSTGTVQYCDVYNLSADLKTIVETKRYSGLNGTGSLISTTAYSGYTSIKNYTSLYPVGYATGPTSETVFANAVYTPAAGAAISYTYTYESNADGYVTKRTSAGGSVNTYEYVKR